MTSFFPFDIEFRMELRRGHQTKLWSSTIGRVVDDFGVPKFGHIGVGYLHKPISRITLRNEINPLLLKYALKFIPDRVELKDGRYFLRTKYNMTVPNVIDEYVSVCKYGDPIRVPLDPFWTIAWCMVSQTYKVMENAPLFDYESSFKWLDRTKSPGWPWSLKYRNKGELVDSDEYRTYYAGFEQKVFDGEFFPYSYMKVFIKRELKKKDKIIAHEPRTVLSCPSELTQLGYRLYVPQNEQVLKPFVTPIFGGISKFAGNWNLMAQKLLKFPNVGDGDCEHFDGTVPADAFNKLRDLRDCYSPGNLAAHNYYYMNMVNSLIIGSHGDIFFKSQGQPSGQSNTMVDNSIVHTSYWYYHWVYKVVPNLPDLESNIQSFRKHVCLFVNGDDVIYSYSDYVREYMLPSKIKITFASIGVKFKFTKDTPSIEEVEFCSMGFKLVENGVYVPVPKREKLLASLLLKPNKNPRVVLKRILALRIECFYDDFLFNFMNSILEKFKVDYSYQLSKHPTYREGDDSFLEDILKLDLSNYALRMKYLYES